MVCVGGYGWFVGFGLVVGGVGLLGGFVGFGVVRVVLFLSWVVVIHGMVDFVCGLVCEYLEGG